ncbi:Hypothetical protein CINCED_3A001025 [Cinara cedri]|uniref:Uncharacterized protein n=1 Tax=Cinara cedri TaxID=506608 RepID=A0A5E4M513_9HEMI|nr:Hypothetical protein CINCED_3A001025 [Cinara cedri]
MNDTTDGVGGGGYGTAVAGQPMIYATVVGGYDQLQTSKGTKSVAIAVDEIESAEGDGGDKPFDESKMIKVSSLNEDTCPGKEQPLVEGAPDAAQNSDRVLLPVKSGGAIFRPTASMQMLSVLLPLSVPVLLALCSRH